ncbi:hypothetical protein [Photorhabdus luminescens]|uniref:hypothetical protein n=1 Tax=Photorhabdus luminescens TaxID=29488 RepID=UPI00223F9931|nr:hypothetical protein [Photorhabdus luminescens]MCW7760494.1 hypothetical protein [Photorhabdus luminescens subsp. venezuelensis]
MKRKSGKKQGKAGNLLSMVIMLLIYLPTVTDFHKESGVVQGQKAITVSVTISQSSANQ